MDKQRRMKRKIACAFMGVGRVGLGRTESTEKAIVAVQRIRLMGIIISELDPTCLSAVVIDADGYR